MGKFGDKLREMRANSGLSVRGFAAELEEIPRVHFSDRGTREIPSSEFVVSVAEFFDVDLDLLLILVKEESAIQS